MVKMAPELGTKMKYIYIQNKPHEIQIHMEGKNGGGTYFLPPKPKNFITPLINQTKNKYPSYIQLVSPQFGGSWHHRRKTIW